MSVTDFAHIAGLFLSAWAAGFGAGYFFKVFRQLWEKVTGFSSGG
jgi:hypothetical protein